MLLYSFLLTGTSSRKTTKKTRRQARHLRGLEMLEPRELLTTFTVTNTGDNGGVDPGPGTGSGTFRQAIVDVNNDRQDTRESPDVTASNIPQAAVHPISLVGALPIISSPAVVDGYTQPGAKPNTLAFGDNAVLLIEIDATKVF